MKKFYAIVYAYGRNVQNLNGTRADHIYKFDTVAERTRFIDEHGEDADALKATDARVKKALRYAEHFDWPQAV